MCTLYIHREAVSFPTLCGTNLTGTLVVEHAAHGTERIGSDGLDEVLT
jgi:hypothetical protein